MKNKYLGWIMVLATSTSENVFFFYAGLLIEQRFGKKFTELIEFLAYGAYLR